MNVRIAIHSYRLPLVCPLDLGGGAVNEREGWIVELTGADGKKGWGEIAPLPGVSPQEEIEAFASWDGETLDESSITPAVRCGLDMAFFNLGDAELMPEALRILNSTRDFVPVNALLIGEIDDMLKQERAAAHEGYQTIKVKVGRQPPAEEVHLLHTINRYSTDDIKFRLDANRAWTPQEAERYLPVFSEMNVEYVEEPFADPHASLAWAQGTGVPLALDDSLLGMEPEDLHRFAGIRAVVLKPTLLGGFSRCVAFAEAARNIGAYPVISGMLESGLGTISLAKFAAALCDDDVATGLDTYRWLDADLLDPRPVIRGGRITADMWDWSRYHLKVD